MTTRVIVSNGHNQFHLRFAGDEAARRGKLRALITAGYPGVSIGTRTFRFLPSSHAARLEARRVSVESALVHSQWSSELLDQIGMRSAALAAYSYGASRIIRRLPSTTDKTIYHYRAGYGGPSLEVARSRGYRLLCDLSAIPPGSPTGSPDWSAREARCIREDLERSDRILVNSRNLANNVRMAGYHAPVSTIYLGVDDAFIAALRQAPPRHESPNLSVLFAGRFQQEKGADLLLESFGRLPEDVRLTIAGSVSKESDLLSLTSMRNVRVAGHVSRVRLAALMRESDVIVLPSRSEGSARVVFEGMAAGCFPVVSNEAGSLIGDHPEARGRLVSTVEADDLCLALEYCRTHIAEVRAAGVRNAELIDTDFRQHHYGERLDDLYEELARS